MVIVLGSVHHNTLSVVRSLGDCNIHPIVVLHGNFANNYIVQSKFISRTYYATSANDILNILSQLYSQYQTRGCIISCSDEGQAIIDDNYDALCDQYYFFNAHCSGRVKKFMDKQEQINLACKNGLLVPKSIKVSYRNSLEICFEKFPCIVKPLQSIKGGKKIDKCTTIGELNDVIRCYVGDCDVQIQEYIEKDYEIVINGLSYGSKVLIPGYVIKHREIAGGTTYSSTSSICNLPTEIIESVEGMIKEIQYEGLFGVEFIVSQGKYYFIEMNLRNDATMYSLVIAGANLPAMFVAVTLNNQPLLPVSVRNINSIVEFRDLLFVLRFKVSLFRWLKEYRLCECKYFKVKDDLQPYRMAKKYFIKSLIEKMLHRIM